MTVYIVMSGDYDGDDVRAVFLDRSEAIAACEILKADDKNDVPNAYYLVEHEVTLPLSATLGRIATMRAQLERLRT